jgi:two-component system, OmpR family, sensor histidine kinase MprB
VSFRKRLTLFSAAGIAVVLVAGSAATYLLVRDQLRDQVDASLRTQSLGVFFVSAQVGPGQGVTKTQLPDAPAQAFTRRLAVSGGRFGGLPVFVGMIDADGEPVVPSPPGNELPITDRAVAIARAGEGSYYQDIELRGTHMRLYVTAPESGRHRALLVARSLEEVDTALSRLGWSLAATCLVGIALAALVGAAVARGALRPVRRLTATAERISRTRDLADRIDVEGGDELGRLGATFNEMLDSLDGALRSQRRLVADASHELRTPLTSLRTNIDLLRQGAALEPGDRERLLRDVTTEIEELTALVANIVDLARGSQRELHLRELRLDEVAELVVSRARTRFPALPVALDAEETTVWGDTEELERAIWNLVENAAKWSEGGVEVVVAGGEVVVRDHGPGVPASDRPYVFDRFYRSEVARGRPGSGLGLAIVRQIAESHGGRVEVDEAPGGGARFRLSLLAAA